MIIKFYFVGDEFEDLTDAIPWKTIIPPSGDHTPLEYFLEDPQCELISEDEVAFLFQDGKPIAFKGLEWTTLPYDVNMWFTGGE